MLNKQDDDGDRDLAHEKIDNFLVHFGHRGMGESARHRSEHTELGKFLRRVRASVRKVPVDQIADEGVQQDDEGGPECVQEEPQLSAVWLFPCKVVENTANAIQHEECCQTNRCVQVCRGKSRECVDDDLVGLISGST